MPPPTLKDIDFLGIFLRKGRFTGFGGWGLFPRASLGKPKLRFRKGTPKNLCDKEFAELSGELSGAISIKTLVSLGSSLELFRKLFGAVRAILWLWGAFLALEKFQAPRMSGAKKSLDGTR